ncbi:MAG: AAA family ATPase [Pseudomonadota bacterium]
MSSIYIPQNIVEDVQSFLLMNAARRTNRLLPVAPMYALAGPSGSGKTTVFKSICADLGVHLEVVPASSMGGMYAGQSSIPVREGIIRAGHSDAWMSAVLIDDLDVTEARMDDNLSGTISSPLLNATLMCFADDPYLLKINDDPEKQRIVPLDRPPVVLITCNDMSKLYEPLARDGRMKHAVLDPKGQDAVPIVQAMYPQTTLADIEKLVGDYPDASVAFFKQLGMQVAEAHAKRVVRTSKPHLPGFDFSAFSRDLATAALGASYDQLATAAKRLSSEDRGKNYLKNAA